MTDLNSEEITQWYAQYETVFDRFSHRLEQLIEQALGAENIEFDSVNSRVKTLTAILEKIERKSYRSLSELTDVVGIRVILFLESDIDKAANILTRIFQAHPEESVDKSDELSVDQIGYRSVHHICSLGEAQIALTEREEFENLKFEIQIRTILQHAWAEIEHDRNYKFPGDIPAEYRRRLNLIAGTLELIDREFSNVVGALEVFSKSQSAADTLPDKTDRITSRSVQQLLAARGKLDVVIVPKEIIGTKVETELLRFGVHNVGELQKLMSEEFFTHFGGNNDRSNSWGVLRSAMMYADLERYFSRAWQGGFRTLRRGTVKMLTQKYGREQVSDIVSQYGLHWAE
ncbi:MAG: hypothetical protein HKN36_10115 [Hellea sp.]|nr:hypothetical protein [Hellea sp.]